MIPSIAIPVTAPASPSVTLSNPPAGGFRSTNAETNVPTAPTGAGASSITTMVGVALVSNTGASLTAMTLIVLAAVLEFAVPSLTIQLTVLEAVLGFSLVLIYVTARR